MGRASPPAEPADEIAEDAVPDPGRTGLVLEEGDRAGLGVWLGDGDAECVGLRAADGDAEWVGLMLADGEGVAGTDADGGADVLEVDGAADGGCDDAPLADGWGELGAGVTALATAGPCKPADSAPASSAPAARRAANARI